MRPAQENRVIFKMASFLKILTKHLQEPRLRAYSYVLVYGQEHSTSIYVLFWTVVFAQNLRRDSTTRGCAKMSR